MKIVIIEDEYAAEKRLKKLLLTIDPSIEVLASIQSVAAAIAWFRQNSPPDLAFVDVQLADGSCFQIFDAVDPCCPLVFGTAFDEYAIRAFKVNSIDYLLKPINLEELRQSLDKFYKYGRKDGITIRSGLQALMDQLQANKEYKSRFLVKCGTAYQSIACGNVAYILIESQLVHLVMRDGKKHVLDDTLDTLEQLLDPQQFHRINRQMVVHIAAVETVHSWFNSRLKLDLIPPCAMGAVVSREKVKGFKAWLGR